MWKQMSKRKLTEKYENERKQKKKYFPPNVFDKK